MADNKTLTTLVKDITYHYIKHFYDKKLKQNNVKKILDEEVKVFVNDMYEVKKTDLQQYIKNTLKDTLGTQYPKLQVNMLVLEMFQDPDFAKERVINEIIHFQNSL
jgi:hypothetical protein